MPKKGETNNPKGRPAGTPNKSTRETRKALQRIMQKEFEKLPEILEAMDPADRGGLIVKMLPFVCPKMPDMPPNYGEETEAELEHTRLIDEIDRRIELKNAERRESDAKQRSSIFDILD